jgi:hypothetical protein
MMYLAMHDALNAIVPKYQQYAFFGIDASAHPIAAAAQAARDVMNHIYPTRQAENDAELAFWLDYRFVPPLEFVYRPAFGDSIPFGIGSSADLPPDSPPPLTSPAYARSVNETKELGRLHSTLRSEDQTNFGAWWLEFNEIQWGRIMRQLTESRGLALLDAARMFALASTSCRRFRSTPLLTQFNARPLLRP